MPNQNCLSCQQTLALVESINAKLGELTLAVESVRDNIEPALESLSNSPIGGMLGIRKKG